MAKTSRGPAPTAAVRLERGAIEGGLANQAASTLRAALHTLAHQLDTNTPGNFISGIAELARNQQAAAASFQSALSSGIPEARDAVLKSARERAGTQGDPQTMDIEGMKQLRSPSTSESTVERFKGLFMERVRETLLSARNAVQGGSAARLPSSGEVTALTLGADLLELGRLVDRFDSCLGKPEPLPTGVLKPLATIGIRLRRAAQLVQAAGEGSDGGHAPETTASKPNTPATVILWEGAAPTDRNIRLARTRSAYLEAHGDVSDALAALKAGGNAIGKSTLYDHLTVLDSECPGWRANVLVSGAFGNPENGVVVRPRGKSRSKVR